MFCWFCHQIEFFKKYLSKSDLINSLEPEIPWNLWPLYKIWWMSDNIFYVFTGLVSLLLPQPRPPLPYSSEIFGLKLEWLKQLGLVINWQFFSECKKSLGQALNWSMVDLHQSMHDIYYGNWARKCRSLQFCIKMLFWILEVPSCSFGMSTFADYRWVCYECYNPQSISESD